MNIVNFGGSQSPVKRPISNPESVTCFFRAEFFGIFIFIKELHFFNQARRCFPDQVKIIIWNKIVFYHKGNISHNRRVFAYLNKFIPELELFFHPLVIGPKETDIRQLHTGDSETLQTEAESPAIVSGQAEI